jgi:hypothetical protein
MQTLFTILITVQFLVVVLHDLVHIPGWSHTRQVRAALGPYKLWIGTAINAIFPGLAAGLAIVYWQRPQPDSVVDYWLIYCAVTLASAVAMSYVPYFFGASEKTKRLYHDMYEGTRQVLPPRGDNPRPNLLHLFFHALFLVNFGLVIALWLRQRG